MDSKQNQEAKPKKTMYCGFWRLVQKARLKWAFLVALLLLLALALPHLLTAYNSTGRCLSSFSKLSEKEMKRRLIKSIVARYLEGAQHDKPDLIKIMFLGRSVTLQELIQRNQSGTLLDLLKERPLLLSDEDELDQFAEKIDMGEFTIINHAPKTTYTMLLLPGKSFYRDEPKTTIDFYAKIKHLNLVGESLSNYGNYSYHYEQHQLDTTCCGGKPLVNNKEIVDAKKRNLELINFIKAYRQSEDIFPVSNCGAAWFPAPDDDHAD